MPAPATLVVNAGSSSIKFQLFLETGAEQPEMRLKGQVEGIGAHPSFRAADHNGQALAERDWDPSANLTHADAFKEILHFVESQAEGDGLAAVGHRVVHGGLTYAQPVIVTPDIIVDLERLIPLAPLHQPHNLAVVKAIAENHPELTQVACFDTAFHRTHDPLADLFAIPRELTTEGVRRYGFHGLSYEYIARALPAIDPKAAAGRVVVAHLGNGSSMCAIRAGLSIDSTMGFTAIDGIPMGTRSGAIDPGVLLYLLEQKGWSPKQVSDLLYKQSGLKGVSGVSNDLRELYAAATPDAMEAIDLFCFRINRDLGALAASMGGVDALVFTAGIGEHAPDVRSRVCERAAWLGLKIDEAANLRGGPLISTPDSAVAVWVVPTNEELMIALHAKKLLAAR